MLASYVQIKVVGCLLMYIEENDNTAMLLATCEEQLELYV